MENTNNTEAKYICSEKDVLNALVKMEDKDRMWLDTQTFDTLVKLVNDKEFRDTTFKNLDWHLNSIPKFKLAITRMCTLALNDKLHNTPEAKKIDNMVETYKGLNRKERLELFKKLEEQKTPDNRMDESKYSWSEFISILHEVFDKVVKA